MKEKHATQHAGLWLDGHHAVLIANAPGNETEDFVVEERITRPTHPDSGSEHSDHQTHRADDAHYFKELAGKLLSYDEFLIFGPGTAQEQFHNFLKKDSHFKDKKISIGSSDKLSDEKMVHRVKSFFTPNTF